MSDETRDEMIIKTYTKLDDLYHTLLGNGQPGKIQNLEVKIEKNRTDLSDLKEAVNVGRGVVIALCFVISLIGGGEILHAIGKL